MRAVCRVGDKAHGDKDATADGGGDGEGFLPGPPDDRDQGGQERDEGQQRQPNGDLAGQQGGPMREVVVGHGRCGETFGSCSLQDAMREIQDGERQTSDRRGSQRPSGRPIQLRTCHQGMIYHARSPAPGQWHDKVPSAGRRTPP
jgi:hypothetical protein